MQALPRPPASEPRREDSRTGTSRDDENRTRAAKAVLSLAWPLSGCVTRAKPLLALGAAKRRNQMPSWSTRLGLYFLGRGRRETILLQKPAECTRVLKKEGRGETLGNINLPARLSQKGF